MCARSMSYICATIISLHVRIPILFFLPVQLPGVGRSPGTDRCAPQAAPAHVGVAAADADAGVIACPSFATPLAARRQCQPFSAVSLSAVLAV